VRKIGQFEAQAADGRVFTICEYEEVVSDRTTADPHDTVAVLIQRCTASGQLVTYEEENDTYEIVEWGLKVRRVPPP
jgi:hypothetical protein